MASIPQQSNLPLPLPQITTHHSSTTTSTKPANYICSLHGLLKSQDLGSLLERLMALSGDEMKEDVKGCEGVRKFREWEGVYIPLVETPFGPSRKDDQILRLRCSLPMPSSTPSSHQQEQEQEQEQDLTDSTLQPSLSPTYTLYHYGPPEPSRLATTSVRPLHIVPLGRQGKKFVEGLGYTFQWGFVREGIEVVWRDFVVIRVYRVFEATTPTGIPPTSLLTTPQIPPSTHHANLTPKDHHLIDLESCFTAMESVAKVSERVIGFAGYLKGLVDMKSVDHLVIENRVKYSGEGRVQTMFGGLRR